MEAREFRGEVIVEVDAELAADLASANDGVTEQARDQSATQPVVFTEAIPAHGGGAAPFDGFGVTRQFSIILGIGRADGADGAHTHSVKVCAGLCGVALKIAVERALFLSNS